MSHRHTKSKTTKKTPTPKRPHGKPLMEMEPQEFEDTMDKIGLSLNRSIIEDARKEIQEIVLAVAILESPGLGSRVVTYDCEYGDNEGNKHIDDFIRVSTKYKLLKPGETMRRVEFRATWKGNLQ